MGQLFINNARATLAASISSGDTLIKIKDHANFPAPGSMASGDFFLLTLFEDTTRYGENLEVVKVTAVTDPGDGTLNLTAERGYEYNASIHTAGTRAEARLTAQGIRDIIAEVQGYTDQQINELVGGAPGALDTLNELAAALNDDAGFSATVTNELSQKLNASAYTAADVLTKLLTVDGAGSSLDADTVDGKHASDFDAAGTAASEVSTHESTYDHTAYDSAVLKQQREALLEEATLYADFENGDYRLYEGVGSGVVQGKTFESVFDFTRGSDRLWCQQARNRSRGYEAAGVLTGDPEAAGVVD